MTLRAQASRAMAPCGEMTRAGPRRPPSKITYIKMDPENCIRNGFAHGTPYTLYIYSHTLNVSTPPSTGVKG